MSKNIKSRENAEKKQKIKNIIFKVIHGISYVCTGLFVAVCIVSCATSQRKQANAEVYPSEIQYRIDDVSESESETSSEISYPIYDDVTNSITLSANQLNNYTWKNFNDTLYVYSDESTITDAIDSFEMYISGPDEICTFSYVTSGSYDEYVHIEFVYDQDYIIYFNLGYDEGFVDTIPYIFRYDEANVFEDFTNSLKISFTDGTSYNAFVVAIQSDIQANEQSDDINVSIFDGITQSITSFIGTLNSGLTAIIGIFWNSTTSTLTPLGILTTLVVGVALFYFVFRLIQGLIRLRG